MNAHKGILGLGLISLGVIVGCSLSLVSGGGVVIVGALLGGLIGGLLYCMIQVAVSRRKSISEGYSW
jgi:hypothetical protein